MTAAAEYIYILLYTEREGMEVKSRADKRRTRTRGGSKRLLIN